MGQAFRRAAGRIKPASSVDSAASSLKMETVVDRKPPPRTAEKVVESGGFDSDSAASSLKMETVVDRKPPPRAAEKSVESGGFDSGGVSGNNFGNVLEERDSQFDAMLGQMVGRIKSKPGGKLEMGEVSVVERFDRPMPKLRNTDLKSSKYEDRPAPQGTLNVAQMRQIILLHEGKADDHDGPMAVHQIAERYNVSVAQIQTIFQFLSLPPEDSLKEKKKDY